MIWLKFTFPSEYPLKPYKFRSNILIFKWLNQCPCCSFNCKYNQNWSIAFTILHLIEDVYGMIKDKLNKILVPQAYSFKKTLENISFRKEIKKEILSDFIIMGMSEKIKEYFESKSIHDLKTTY